MRIALCRAPVWFSVIYSCLGLYACALVERPASSDSEGLGTTASLIEDVKAFGRTLGIEPTAALSRSSNGEGVRSMLWFWLQKEGTLALRTSVDIRMAVGFGAAQERIPLEQLYRVDGYSVYYRQGNEYADPASAATPSFAAQGIVRRVTVILHEDLHGDANFALPWDIEEAVVTPLASLAAVEYFKYKGDAENVQRAQAALSEARQLSRELTEVARVAAEIFRSEPMEDAKRKVLSLLEQYPAYQRVFRRQIAGQHPPTVLEAKLSHDLAYFRYFDAVTALVERAPGLKALIAEMKALPLDSTLTTAEEFVLSLHARHAAPGN